MIIKAKMKDVQDIMNIVQGILKEMEADQHDQWDETYPRSENFKQDIENGDLYMDIDDNNDIKGFICINQEVAEPYNNLQWSSDDYMAIHRFGVNLANRKQGVGSGLIRFAEELAREKGFSYMRTDTYSLNKKMNGLFSKHKYRFVGEIDLGKDYPFNCYEKKLI